MRPHHLLVLLAALWLSLAAGQTETLYVGTNANVTGDDNVSALLPIGFDFTYFGTTHNQVAMSTNGLMLFGSTGGSAGETEFSNVAIPATAAPNNFIAPFWDDLIPKDMTAYSLYHHTIGSSPNRIFVAQWTNMYFFSNQTLQMGTFQALLYEGTNEIQVQYRTLMGSAESFGSSATIGIENADGSAGVQHSYNTSNAIVEKQAIRFTPSGGTYTMNAAASYEWVYLTDAAAPGMPTLTSPASGATGVSTSPTFSWTASDPAATSYRLLVSSDSSFSAMAIDTSTTSTSYAASGLAENTTYYWKVIASNSSGETSSGTSSFTTVAPPPPVEAITVFNPDFSTNQGMYQLNGSAVYNGSYLKLTDPVGGQAGSAFWKDRVVLSGQRSFSTHFSFLIDQPSGNRADGLAFVIQTVSNAAGSAGGGLGYEGISPSFVVEFDTYTNNDPNNNHVGININGNTTSVATWIPPFDLVGATRYAWIDYDGATDRIEVRLSTTNTRPASADLSYTADLATVLTQEEVYVGFSAATGGEWERHQIASMLFDNEYDPIDTSTTTYEQAVSTIELVASPASISHNGTDASTLTARALYPDGSVASGRVLDFSVQSGAGTLSSATATTDANGYASVTFTSSTVGSAVIRSSVPEGAYRDVTVTVTNTAPAAGGDTTVGPIPEDDAPYMSPNITLAVPTLSDPDGGTPTQIRVLSATSGDVRLANGTAIAYGPDGTLLTLSSGSIDLQFVPASNFNGTASFQYVVVDPSDSSLNSAASTVSVPVTAVNDPPILTTATGSGGNGLFATYYLGTTNLSGSSFSRLDPIVDFPSTPTGVPGLNPDSYSVRWTGELLTGASGTYTFRTYSDDGVRLYVNGSLIIDKWVAQSPTYHSATISLPASAKVDITLEFYEGGGGDRVTLEWQPPGTSSPVVIPTSNLFADNIRSELAYVEDSGPVAVDDAVTATDVDSAAFSGATVRFAYGYRTGEDVLGFDDANPWGIAGSFDAASGVLTLTGSSSPANYQAALRSVTYLNTSHTPYEGVRQVAFRVQDGADPSNDTYRNVRVSERGDAPTITSFTPTSGSEGATVTITGTWFVDVSSVTVGGVPAFDYTVDSATQITATVAYGSSGAVSVTTPDGTGARSGFTYVPSATYTFDYLQEGLLDGQDGWTSTPTGNSNANQTFQVLTPGVSTPLHGGGQNTAVAGHDGSPAARFPFGGAGIGAQATRVDNANWALPDFAADSVYVVEFEMQHTHWGGEFWLGQDGNGDGVLSGAGEYGLGLDVSDRNGVSLRLPDGSSVPATSAPAGGFRRYQIVVDRVAYGGAGSASVWSLDLSGGATAWQAVPGLQDVRVGFTTGADAANPLNWDAFRLHGESWDPSFLFDNLTVRRVEPSARSFTFPATNVGSVSAPQTLALEGDHLRGNLTATASGDFRIDGVTTVSGLGHGSSLEVTFHPSAGGERTGTITIDGDDMVAPLVIALAGEGIPPTITGFTPNDANTGATIEITGVNLTGATSVAFGGTEAYDFTVHSDTRITAVLAGGSSGSIVVTTPNGVATFDGFTAQPPGGIYIEVAPGAGRYTLPADHPILADGRIDRTEYAGDLSLDPSATGTFSALGAAPVDVHAAGGVHVIDPLDANAFGGARDVTLRADGAIVLESGGGIVSAGGTITLVTPTTFTNHAGAAALDPGADRFLVYSVTPEDDTTGGLAAREVFGVVYPANPIRDGNVLYYASSLIEGYVFEDADVDLVRGAGESGIGGVTVATGGRTALTDANGRYRFIGLPAGSYTVAATPPAGYVAVATDERTVELTELGVATGRDFGYFAGSRVDGTVFFDDGYAGGTPNDALRNGSETGSGGVELSATHDAGLSSAATDAAGAYTLFVPAGAGTVNLSHDAALATGSSDGATATLSDAAPGDLVTFTPAAGERYRYDFGLVRRSSLSPAQTGQVAAPGSRTYDLRYQPGTQGTLTLALGEALLEYRLYIDGACIGESGSVHVPAGGSVTVGSAWPRSGDRLDACTVQVQVLADSATSPGTVDTVTLDAALAWSGQSTVDTARAATTTEVTGEGVLQLAKQGRNVTQGGSFADRLEGRPGDVIEYRIDYRNTGTAPVFEVDLRAEASAATEVLTASGDAVLVCPDGASVPLTLTGSSIGIDLAAHCALVTAEHPDGVSGAQPALHAGEGGTLTYRVQIR